MVVATQQFLKNLLSKYDLFKNRNIFVCGNLVILEKGELYSYLILKLILTLISETQKGIIDQQGPSKLHKN